MGLCEPNSMTLGFAAYTALVPTTAMVLVVTPEDA